MIRSFLRIGWLVAIGMVPLALSAQSLDATDTAEIQQKALRHVRQLEGLLNVISQSDEYFRKYSFDQLIRNYYSDQSSYQIFRDSLVVVEDDLNPKPMEQDYGNLLTIKDYLKAFFSLYQKSPPPSVVFSNYEVSDVKNDEFLYVEVQYDSKFRNRHRAYPDLPYPVRRRRATVKAEPQNSGWRVIITDIGYARPGDERPSPPVALRRTEPRDTTKAVDPSSLSETKRPPTAAPVPSESGPATESVNSSSSAFANTRRVYRIGKKYPLPVQFRAAPPSASLVLYQDEEMIRDVSNYLADSVQEWQIPRTLSPGGNYYLRFYNPVSEEATESPTFSVRRRARWPWIVGAIGAAAVVYAVTNGGDGAAESPEENDELPPPPFPE